MARVGTPTRGQGLDLVLGAQVRVVPRIARRWLQYRLGARHLERGQFTLCELFFNFFFEVPQFNLDLAVDVSLATQWPTRKSDDVAVAHAVAVDGPLRLSDPLRRLQAVACVEVVRLGHSCRLG